MEGTRLSLGQPRLIQVLWEETSMARWQSLLYLAYPLLAALLGQLLKLVLVSRSLEIAPTSPAALAASLGLALLLVTPLALLSGRLTAVAAVLLSALSGAVAWIDASYYRYFTDLPSARQLSHAWQLTDVGGSVGSLLRWSDLWLFADTVALALLFWYFPPRWAPWSARLASAGLSGALAVSLILGCGPLMTAGQLSVLAVRFKAWATAAELGLPYYHWDDLQRLSRTRWNRSRPADDPQDLLARCRASADSMRTPTPYAGLARGNNVLILLLESWHGFSLDLELEGGEKVMPFLSSFKDRCLYFPHYYDQSNQAASSDGEFLINLSLQPAQQGAAVFTYHTNTFQGLPKILSEAGYSTLYFGYYDPGFWNAREMIPAYGFQEGVFAPFGPPPRPEERVGWGLADFPLLSRVVPIALSKQPPFYAVVHCSMGHHPWLELPPERRELKLSPELEGNILGDYLQMCRFRDRNMAAFIQAFERSPLAANTTLVITGDHATSLSPQEMQPVMPIRDGVSPTLIHASMQTTPLLIRLPSGQHGELPQTVGQLDFAPTIAHLLGVDPPTPTFLGRNAFLGSTLVAMRRLACVTDGKMLVSLTERSAIRLPDLTPVPYPEAQQLEQQGMAQWHASEEILEHNLVPWLMSELSQPNNGP
jgi:lipoteichoic acid synthase